MPFNQVDFSDVFFDSLKSDYAHGFIDWFHSKCKSNDYAYVLYDEQNKIDGFLYLKTEVGIIEDTKPNIPDGIHLKVGTFKFNPKGTLRGQRFLKKIFDHALDNNANNIYVTVFEKHDYLIRLFKIYGFIDIGVKESENGVERVLIKEMNSNALTGDILSDYPFINNRGSENKFLLSIYPVFHTRLFPDSKLITESPDVVADVSYANSIRKVYICGMSDVELMKPNDIIVIYRTSDNQGPAYYRSVATSLCVVEKVRNINSFVTEKEFLNYCSRYSVFTESELKSFYRTKKYPYIISFTYNLALPKRLNRAKLISEVGLSPRAYWGIMKLTNEQFNSIIKLGGVNESIIVN
ncbi:N-acetyltransferase [Escherichia coli]|nr:N-acetyltransferase [Escherichia coli]HBK2612396.1 N-acetyltransferase [Escherichia coli]